MQARRFIGMKSPLYLCLVAAVLAALNQPAFYDSREMKELGLEMIKVHGSRMVGSLMTPSHTFAVFNGMDAVPTFDTQIEQRGKIMLQNIRYTRTGASHTPDGILLSDQWAVMTTLLEDAKTYKKEHFLFGEGYEHFYFLTNDYHGETLSVAALSPGCHRATKRHAAARASAALP